MLQYIFFSMLQYLQPDVALHSFPYVFAMLQLKCYILFWDSGAVGERVLGSGGRAGSIFYAVPRGGRRGFVRRARRVPCGTGVLFRAGGGGGSVQGRTLGRTRGASERATEAGHPGARYVVPRF
jgi:hypothetical protein